MALQAAYRQFLDAPSPELLASDASLHYVTTLTTHNSSTEIIKHLKSQTRLLKKKEEKFLDAVEAPNALAVEVETTIEFVLGGGAYLPGLDDNFLADRTVTFPVVSSIILLFATVPNFIRRSTLSASMELARSNKCDKTGTKDLYSS